ncbi:MAG: hypothetical protein WBM14_19300, partial [Terracidiphilus sp.]
MLDQFLPGQPSKKRQKDVRRLLSSWGIKPMERPWRLAWEWAYKVSASYYHFRWPLTSEIVAQYMAILLIEMQSSWCLKLPHRAGDQMPESVMAHLVANPSPKV